MSVFLYFQQIGKEADITYEKLECKTDTKNVENSSKPFVESELVAKLEVVVGNYCQYMLVFKKLTRPFISLPKASCAEAFANAGIPAIVAYSLSRFSETIILSA